MKEIYRLKLPDAVSTAINGTTITMIVPPTADVKALAPVFEPARFATSAPPSGTVRDFSTPQIYKITAQDGSSQTVTPGAGDGGDYEDDVGTPPQISPQVSSDGEEEEREEVVVAAVDNRESDERVRE